MADDNFSKFTTFILVPASLGYIAGKVAKVAVTTSYYIGLVGLGTVGYKCYKDGIIENKDIIESQVKKIYNFKNPEEYYVNIKDGTNEGYKALVKITDKNTIDKIKNETQQQVGKNGLTALAVGGATFFASYYNKI
ncbi:MAG: hypothetical protein CMF62_01575 [Magnetococcales bacterium]|nr:hypothetical protein [Magnetococcales bacterium]|tara:strand:+ start:45485 stop:45892 length:408 start_codon:yes stop_codon:yes gene_type:complete